MIGSFIYTRNNDVDGNDSGGIMLSQGSHQIVHIKREYSSHK